MIGEIFTTILLNPTLNALIALYKVFEQVGAPGPLGFAILSFTVILRILLWPIMAQQLRSAKKMSALSPKLNEIKKKYAKDKVMQQQKQAELFKENGVNPASGCLPLILQLVVLIAIYNVLSQVVSAKSPTDLINHINSVLYFPQLHLSIPLDQSFLGTSLATKPADWAHIGLWLLIFPVLTVGLQLIQSKMMLPNTPKVPKKKDDKKNTDDFASTMASTQQQLTLILPFMTGFFVYLYPLGLALYWNTFTLFGILQQYKIGGWGQLPQWVKFLDKERFH